MNLLKTIDDNWSKSTIAIKAKTIAEKAVENGTELEIASQIATLETLLKELKGNKELKACIREGIEKYGKSYTDKNGTKLELAETGTSYDYSVCGDNYLTKLNKELEDLTSKIKSRQDFLKTIPLSGLLTIDEETGEAITLYPPTKTSTSSYKVTIKK